MSEEKKHLAKIASLPSRVKQSAALLKAWVFLKASRFKAWVALKLDLSGGFNKQGKTVLRLGRDTMTTKNGEALFVLKTRSNFWTRLKNIVLMPWRYLFTGKFEL